MVQLLDQLLDHYYILCNWSHQMVITANSKDHSNFSSLQKTWFLPVSLSLDSDAKQNCEDTMIIIVTVKY